MLFVLLNSDFNFWQALLFLLALALTVVTALVVHEWSHAWMALKQGDGTAKAMGRLTLNPAKHIDPIGLFCLAIGGFGWAKPVPVNPFNYRNYRRGNFWVSVAGVISNFILAFLFSLLFFLMWRFGNSGNLAIFFLTNLGRLGLGINVSLIIFNLLPIYPLDGYNMLSSLVKPDNKFMKFMRDNGLIILLLFVLFGNFLVEPLMGALSSAFLSFWGLFI